jgi:hypothetical protein
MNTNIENTENNVTTDASDETNPDEAIFIEGDDVQQMASNHKNSLEKYIHEMENHIKETFSR